MHSSHQCVSLPADLNIFLVWEECGIQFLQPQQGFASKEVFGSLYSRWRDACSLPVSLQRALEIFSCRGSL